MGGTAHEPARPRLGRTARREQRAAYLFLSPWLIGLVAFWIVPIVVSIVLSATYWNIITPPHWAGLQNYRDISLPLSENDDEVNMILGVLQFET